MPRKPDPEYVGTGPCLDCSNEADVYLQRRGYLYQRCGFCGACDQRISERVQAKMFYQLAPAPGVTVQRPRNVPENRPDYVGVPEPDAALPEVPENPATTPVAPVHVPEPATVPETVPVPMGKPEKKSKAGAIFLFLATLGLTAAGVRLAIN